MNAWWPAGVLLLGVALTTVGIQPQRSMPLRAPLPETISRELDGWPATDREVSKAEQRVSGMSSYVLRVHTPTDVESTAAEAAAFSVYVGYYERQAQGRTIHSPKNCLPGGGWESLTSTPHRLQTALGTVTLNRFLIAKGQTRALVLYWYQGRGRIASNEYVVKWDLLRDQALLGRSDEALVRVVVPVTTTEEAALAQAERVARQLVSDVDRALPPRSART